jgi:uncharacterized protein
MSKLTRYWRLSKKLKISFYGGEPLLGFKQIETIIKHLKAHYSNMQFSFQMTTNGTLLKKYLNYLIENDFKIIISLDGNIEQNAYRKYKNGRSSFRKVYENISYIKMTHPKYFANNVQFASVLHAKNDIISVQTYFKNTFGKMPTISSLNTSNLNKQKKDKFGLLYKAKHGVIPNIDVSGGKYIRVPGNNEIEILLSKVLQLNSNNLIELLKRKKYKKSPAQKTCIPFSRKLFLTTKGYIYPCETISRKIPLGFYNRDIDDFNLDVNQVSHIYNELLKKYQRQCSTCYISNFCFQCIFDVISSGIGRCKYYYNHKRFVEYIQAFIDYFELDKEDYAYSID